MTDAPHVVATARAGARYQGGFEDLGLWRRCRPSATVTVGAFHTVETGGWHDIESGNERSAWPAR
jgi:hypothetical protein